MCSIGTGEIVTQTTPAGGPRSQIDAIAHSIIGKSSADAYGAPLRDGETQCLDGRLHGGMFVDPMTLQPDEAQQVARRLPQVLIRI